MVHSFTCAGILASQYINLSQFAGLGTVGNAYIRQGSVLHIYCLLRNYWLLAVSVYHGRGYLEIVSRAAEISMQSAVEEVQSLPEYAEKGEVKSGHVVCSGLLYISHISGSSLMPGMTPLPIRTTPQCHAWQEGIRMTDCYIVLYITLYVSTCVLDSTQRIVGLSTINRTEHSVAQTRELQCTKAVLPQVISRGKNHVCKKYMKYFWPKHTVLRPKCCGGGP